MMVCFLENCKITESYNYFIFTWRCIDTGEKIHILFGHEIFKYRFWFGLS